MTEITYRVEQIERQVKDICDRLGRDNIEQMFKTIISRGNNDRLLADERHTALIAQLNKIDARCDEIIRRLEQNVYAAECRHSELVTLIEKLQKR